MKSKTVKVRIKANEPIDKLAHKFDRKTLFKILIEKLKRTLNNHDSYFSVSNYAIVNLTGIDTAQYIRDKMPLSKFEEELLMQDDRYVILEGVFV